MIIIYCHPHMDDVDKRRVTGRQQPVSALVEPDIGIEDAGEKWVEAVQVFAS